LAIGDKDKEVYMKLETFEMETERLQQTAKIVSRNFIMCKDFH